MSHVPTVIILKDAAKNLVDVTDYAGQIHANIEAGVYTGQDLTDANDLLDNLETNADAARSSLADSASAMKTFLG